MKRGMCGLFGVIASGGGEPLMGPREVRRVRDRLAHRGPDDAGLREFPGSILAHTRLAVIDPGPAGRQPMLSPDGAGWDRHGPRWALVYNGELYNDHALRAELDRSPDLRPWGPWRSSCDTETFLRALAVWGPSETVRRARGMFAFALLDRADRSLVLGRDALGVKPLYWGAGGGDAVFASEPWAVAEHPAIGSAPDLPAVSAYLTTIRSVLGDRTLLAGVRAVEPGTLVRIETTGAEPRVGVSRWRTPPAQSPEPDPAEDGAALHDAAASLRCALADAARAHLRADVPVCSLLSGGIDSTVLAALALEPMGGSLRTYAAGAAPDPAAADADDDLSCARSAARALGVDHAEALLTPDAFTDRWREMVRRQRWPLSTPNETAIWAVAERLRADGCVVTISGEGADELLGGYDAPLSAAWNFESARGSDASLAAASPGLFALLSAAWVSPAAKPGLLTDAAWAAARTDAPLAQFADSVYAEEIAHAAAVDPAAARDRAAVLAMPLETRVGAHLRVQRRVNLAGLLRRLDGSTMLASVEGRTPFADTRLADLAEAMPLSLRFRHAPALVPAGAPGASPAAPPMVESKRALRRAARGLVPDWVAERPKQSFPLPFADWMAPAARDAIGSSAFVRELVRPDVLAETRRDPTAHWRLAWPLANLAMWAG